MASFYKVNLPRLLTVSAFKSFLTVNAFRNMASAIKLEGLVVGAYQADDKSLKLTGFGEKINDKTDGKLLRQLKLGKPLKNGDTRIFWELDEQYKAICVVGLGSVNLAFNELEQIDEKREAVRVASAAGYRALKQIGANEIVFDSFNDLEACAEGATLSCWTFNKYKTANKQTDVSVSYCDNDVSETCQVEAIKAQAQNLARHLSETPANLMTPTMFAETVKQELEPFGVEVTVHDEAWLRAENMGAVLAVAHGTHQKPTFLELTYNNALPKTQRPYLLIGEGITFDSGGISLKRGKSMQTMRADMGGAACVVAVIKAIAQMKLPIHIVGLTPLTENMPSGTAIKPGDVIVSRSGKTICVNNTDAEGRLVLADALSFAGMFRPKMILDVATLTGAIRIELGAHAAAGCDTLKSIGITKIACETFGDAEATAEGTTLGTWEFKEYKTKSEDEVIPIEVQVLKDSNEEASFQAGVIKASAQNFARKLMDTPANLMTPTIFGEMVYNQLTPLGVTVNRHGIDWIKAEKMGSFLSVAQGSQQPPVFLELLYNNAKSDDKPYVLIGKGITFDSGGISLKPPAAMDEMRADMGGAACVVSTIKAIAELKLPINVVGLTPLAENLPSGTATKPGDVVVAKNGKTICVDNTDAEGRLVLADAFCYSEKFAPKFIVELSTLTGAMCVAVGNNAAGVFTNSKDLWNNLLEASISSGDRVWRMPLWKCYGEKITGHSGYDVNNCETTRYGGACTAAAFLREFVPKKVEWAHMDIAPLSGPKNDQKYLKDGMAGRPTRTLIGLFQNVAERLK